MAQGLRCPQDKSLGVPTPSLFGKFKGNNKNSNANCHVGGNDSQIC